MNEILRPRHSSLGLAIILGIFLFATYFVFVPGIIKKYEKKLEVEREKLDKVTTRLELHQKDLNKAVTEIKTMHDLGRMNNKLLREIHDSVTHNR